MANTVPVAKGGVTKAEVHFAVPEDDAGHLYFDTGFFVEELPDSSLHMPEYKYTVTGHRKKVWPSAGPGRVQVGRQCLVNGKKIALFRYGHQIVAISDTCSHAGGQLHLGDIEEIDGTICVSCPRHGFCFDLASGRGVRPETYQQQIFPVRLSRAATRRTASLTIAKTSADMDATAEWTSASVLEQESRDVVEGEYCGVDGAARVAGASPGLEDFDVEGNDWMEHVHLVEQFSTRQVRDVFVITPPTSSVATANAAAAAAAAARAHENVTFGDPNTNSQPITREGWALANHQTQPRNEPRPGLVTTPTPTPTTTSTTTTTTTATTVQPPNFGREIPHAAHSEMETSSGDEKQKQKVLEHQPQKQHTAEWRIFVGFDSLAEAAFEQDF